MGLPCFDTKAPTIIMREAHFIQTGRKDPEVIQFLDHLATVKKRRLQKGRFNLIRLPISFGPFVSVFLFPIHPQVKSATFGVRVVFLDPFLAKSLFRILEQGSALVLPKNLTSLKTCQGSLPSDSQTRSPLRYSAPSLKNR